MLTEIEGRVLGCLLEKERTVPDQYPLTLNALASACNQTSSRDPLMRLDDHEVDGALTSLKAQGLVRFVHPSHGRSVTRYRQVAGETWGLGDGAAAVLALLLLRGPQTVAELRNRSERLHAFSSNSEVEAAIDELAGSGRVHLLPRQHGQKEERWQQLVAEERERSAARPPAAGGGTEVGADRLAQLEARVARLEAALGDLLPPLED